MKVFRRNKKGFTLIEVLVVIAIFGILSAIVTVSTMAILRSSKKKTVSTKLENYWSTTTTAFNQINKGFSTFDKPNAEFLGMRLGLDKKNVYLGTDPCASLPNDNSIYIQYEYNAKSLYSKYKLKCIWIRYEGSYYYTSDGSSSIGPKSTP